MVKEQKAAPPASEANDIKSMATNQRVTVTVKVKSVDPTERVKNRDGKELVKQDCVVVDSSGCTHVVVWEKDVGRLQEDSCYKLVGASVRTFRGVTYMYLSTGGECSMKVLMRW